MKNNLIIQVLVSFAAIATLLGVNAYSVPSKTTTATVKQGKIQYATLTLSQGTNANSEVIYRTYFNFGIQEFLGQSRNSREDSYRNLIARLGGNTSQINIYTLMDAIGGQGWELIETNYEEERIVRIFMRR